MRYVGKHGIVRPRDIEAIGLPREYLVRLHRQGKLNRLWTWNLHLPNANVTERHSYAEVAKRVPERCYLPAFGPCLSRDHDPESCFGLDRSPQGGKNACPYFAFTQDRPPVRPVAD